MNRKGISDARGRLECGYTRHFEDTPLGRVHQFQLDDVGQLQSKFPDHFFVISRTSKSVRTSELFTLPRLLACTPAPQLQRTAVKIEQLVHMPRIGHCMWYGEYVWRALRETVDCRMVCPRIA